MLPPRRILAAVDFSPGSRAALTFAARLAKQCGAELHLLHAIEPRGPDGSESPLAGHGAEAIRERRAVYEELERVVGVQTGTPDPLEIHVVNGEAADVLVHLAARERADLIVLGTHGRQHPPSEALGATLAKVLERTSVPTLAIPSTWMPPCPHGTDLHGVGPVIAALNVTCPAVEGAAAACSLAAVLNTKAILLHAIAPSEVGGVGGFPASRGASSVSVAGRDIEVVTTALRERSSAPLELATEIGEVADVLTRTAERYPHALMVLGRSVRPHAYGPPCSIATRLLRSDRIPVLMYIDR